MPDQAPGAQVLQVVYAVQLQHDLSVWMGGVPMHAFLLNTRRALMLPIWQKGVSQRDP